MVTREEQYCGDETCRLLIEGERIYTTIKPSLKRLKLEERIVAIEIDTGDYFTGRTLLDAYENGHRKHPDKVFYFAKIQR